MTVHIAFSLNNGSEAIIVADSQASSDKEESHGMQKIFAGDDFLVGGAGSGLIIQSLFQKLSDDTTIDATNVIKSIETFVNVELRPNAWGQVGVLAITPSGGAEPAIQQFSPGVFSHFSPRCNFKTIGSGSEFVSRAIASDRDHGISIFWQSIADMLIAASKFADAATNSLTVDEFNLIGILRNGRTYLLGHRDISPTCIAPALTAHGTWSGVSSRYEQILAIIETIHSEIGVAMRTISPITRGELTVGELPRLVAANSAIATLKQSLDQELEQFYKWYDAVMSRP